MRAEAAEDLAGRPYEETRALVAESVRCYAAQMLSGDTGPRDAFITRVTALRSSLKFRPSTLLRGFLGFRRGVAEALARDGTERELEIAVLREVDDAYVAAALSTVDIYVAKLNAVIDATRGELVRREKLAALGGLVAGVAHEINTPLGIAVTAVSLAQDRIDELEQSFGLGTLRKQDLTAGLAQAREATGMSLANLRRASDLVTNFKQIAVDQASEARRRVALGQYVREVVGSLAPLYRRTPHRVAVEVRADPLVATYAGAISQICTNLLQNALIHAFAPGQVGKVTFWVDRAPDGALELGCNDDGVGIPGDVLPRLYEPFFTTTRGRAGSGLGLHIVHNLVTELLRGSITAESPPEGGARFTIRFVADAGGPDDD